MLFYPSWFETQKRLMNVTPRESWRCGEVYCEKKKKILISLLISQSTVECFPFFPPTLIETFCWVITGTSVLKINAGIHFDSLVVLGCENSFRCSLIVESAGDQTSLTIKISQIWQEDGEKSDSNQLEWKLRYRVDEKQSGTSQFPVLSAYLWSVQGSQNR